jgi:hypothetical protein
LALNYLRHRKKNEILKNYVKKLHPKTPPICPCLQSCWCCLLTKVYNFSHRTDKEKRKKKLKNKNKNRKICFTLTFGSQYVFFFIFCLPSSQQMLSKRNSILIFIIFFVCFQSSTVNRASNVCMQQRSSSEIFSSFSFRPQTKKKNIEKKLN